MGSRSRNRRDWEDLAELDPYWAVVTAPNRKFGGWDPVAFFETGEQDVSRLLDTIDRLGYPQNRGKALDFGCGVGRIARALATRFDECCGVDISERMISRARELNAAVPTCTFVHDPGKDLGRFEDGTFDLVYCKMVLQHLVRRRQVRSYIREFLRVTCPGGLLVFQIPSCIPFHNRIQLRTRLYSLLRTLGFGKDFLYHRLDLVPIRMGFMPEPDVIRLVTESGGRLLEVDPEPCAGPTVASRTYYVTKQDVT